MNVTGTKSAGNMEKNINIISFVIYVSMRETRREAEKYAGMSTPILPHSALIDTQINVFSVLVLLCQRAAFLLQLLTVAFDVLDHQVLPGQLIVVGEVVNHLVI